MEMSCFTFVSAVPLLWYIHQRVAEVLTFCQGGLLFPAAAWLF